MKDAQKPDHISFNTLINRLREGRFVIPDFQREFEWNPWDIRELMRSIFLDYYIGSLLLWNGKKENFDALSCEPIYGFQGNKKPEYIVLDGQQRLTAIYYAFLLPDLPLPRRSNRFFFFVRVNRFMAEEYDQAFDYGWSPQHWSKMFNNPELQYKEHIFPLYVIGQGGWSLPNWVQGYEKFWRDQVEVARSGDNQKGLKEAILHADNAKEFGEHVKGITEEYQISYIELDQDLQIDKVCDIFTQINSRGVQLDTFDLINALLKPKGLKLKELWRNAASRLEFVNTEKMNVYILQVMSILRQVYCSPKYLYFLLPGQEKTVRDSDGTRRKEILISDVEDFKNCWLQAVSALEEAIELLRHPQEFGAISSNYMPYVSILPVFAALQAHVKTLTSERQLDAQQKIRHWYWASVFTNRYSGAVESTSARDFLDVKAWIENNNAEPSLLLEFKTRFKNLDLRKEIKRGTSLYNGIFNLLIIKGARDWITGNIPQPGDLDDHHIVPVSWGNKYLKDNSIHTVLNRTPLTAKTNREIIKDRLPNAYLPELMKLNDKATISNILESHFISAKAQEILLQDPFTVDSFEMFIAERQRTLQEAIEDLLIKGRVDLSPQLRELDIKIEHVELELRNLICLTLSDDINRLPGHVQQKTNERIQNAAKKNPILDIERYKNLAGKLEFCDLRELQDIITGKQLWTEFERVFVNKETMIAKFGQLADLRNGIRHSRTVDEVIRKEGEAAILWFTQVLKNKEAL